MCSSGTTPTGSTVLGADSARDSRTAGTTKSIPMFSRSGSLACITVLAILFSRLERVPLLASGPKTERSLVTESTVKTALDSGRVSAAEEPLPNV